MANTLDSIKAKILARALMVLRTQVVMPLLVNRDIANVGQQRGDVINVPIPTAIEATDVVPSHVPPANVDTTPKTVAVTLDQWKEAAFHLTDKELNEIDASATFLPLQTQSAVEALARAVNSSIFSKYKKVGSYNGTAGTTPFASSDDDAIQVRKTMALNNVPGSNRNFVLDPNATAKALALASFKDVSQAGKTSVKIEGELGRFFGFDFYEDTQVPTHTAGTITTGLIAKAATAVASGAKSFVATTAASTGAAALLAGDVIAIAGHTRTYSLAANATQASAATDVTLTINEPGLERALVGSEAITVKATHVVNLAFHRDAFAFAMRPLAQTLADYELGSEMISMRDPQTGLVMRLEITRQHKQTKWSFDMLWGAEIVRPELAVRLAG